MAAEFVWNARNSFVRDFGSISYQHHIGEGILSSEEVLRYFREVNNCSEKY